jgi:hypothetical protein
MNRKNALVRIQYPVQKYHGRVSKFKKRRDKMKKMFNSIIAGFTKGMSEDDKKKMMACGEKMAGMCSCVNRKDMSEEEKKSNGGADDVVLQWQDGDDVELL